MLPLVRTKCAGDSTGRDTEMYAHRTTPQDSMIDRMLAELHELERRLTIASIAEAIRLLKSEKFHQLTSEQIRSIGNYQPIRIEDEWFFDKAFSTGKEVAASLAYAGYVGREVVLEDLVRLRAAASGSSESPP